MDRVEVIHRALVATGGDRYLEIGVSRGTTFRRVEAGTKVAVDPRFRFRVPVAARVAARLGRRTGTLYFEEESDRFFAAHAERLAPFHVVFVDGLHTAEQALRDVRNAVAHLAPGGVVVLHDCNPASAPAAAPSLEEATAMAGYTGAWNGDVFKAVVRIRATEPDLDAAVLDTDQGLGVVQVRPPAHPLDLDPAVVDALTYDDLAADRAGLLDLRPPDALEDLLGPA